MKKHRNLFRPAALFTALLGMTLFLSCNKDPEPEPEPVPKEPTALAAPVLTVNSLTEDGFTVSWTPVENAAFYYYELNGTGEDTDQTEIVFSGLTPGTYLVRVMACAGDNGDFKNSEYAEKEVMIETPEEPIEEPTKDIRAEAYYAGDYYGTGSGNGWINFIQGDIEVDDWGDATGEGRILCIDLNFTLPDNPDFATLPEGTYTIGAGDGAPFTWNAEGNSYVISAGSGFSDNGAVTGGTVTVSPYGTDGGYRIVCELTAETGPLTLEYRGKVSFINHSGEGVMSNLPGDLEVTSFTQGSQTWFGDLFGTGESETYMVVLADDDYDLSTNFGMGESVVLYLNVPNGSSDGVPAGHYEDLLDINVATEAPAGTCIGGIYDYGTYMGCWYFHTEEQIEARFVDGSVDVTRDGDTWTFEGALKDGHGNTVTFSYSGPLLFAEG